MTQIEQKNQRSKPASSLLAKTPWLLLGLLIVGDAIWLAGPTISGWYQSWLDYQEACLNLKMESRQNELEARLSKLKLPIFGVWEQVGPLESALADVQAPERRPGPNEEYAFARGEKERWQRIPQYVDGYANLLKLSHVKQQAFGHKTAVCLARTVTCDTAQSIPVYVSANVGFVLWLNGKSLLLSDTGTESIESGMQVANLELRPGENRLTLKLHFARPDCQFFFQPEFGKEKNNEVLAELAHQFPVSIRRVDHYRELARHSGTVTEERFYPLMEIPAPDDIFLEGGGLSFLPDGRLAVGTRRGFVYLVQNVTSTEPDRATFSQHASGLHEVLGLTTDSSGQIDVAQRGSLTRIEDKDQDGIADCFRNINNEWGLSGNYHEYTLDLERDPAGNYYSALSLSDTGGGTNVSLAPFRGWIMQVTPKGKLVPWCFGFRCCNGLGWNANGDLFATDNQGQWVPASPVYHVRRDHYYGSPASIDSLSLCDSEEARRRASRSPTPPACWIPYEEFCMSASDIVCDTTKGQFGPFADQLFVGDMMKGTIVRVALEKIEGEYQGACFLFRRGVGAVNRMTFGPDHRLYLTRAARGWGGAGKGEGLARIEFTGETPMEMECVKLLPEGFEVRMTRPLASSVVPKSAGFRIERFRYEHWEKYGSPKVDRELIPIRSIVVSPDRKSLTFKIEKIKSQYIYHLSLPRLESEQGLMLLHTDAFYTVNQLAVGEKSAF